MKRIRIFVWIAFLCAIFSLPVPLSAQATGGQAELNLLSWGAGALVVLAPPSYSDSGNWAPESSLDELPSTGWANKEGYLTPKVFVFEMADKSTITSLAFDTNQVESPLCDVS